MGLPLSYPQAKVETLEVIDDFAALIDVLAGYGSPGRYNAQTRLSEIGLDAAVRTLMVKRVNKAFTRFLGWKDVGPDELAACEVIGDMIAVVCKHGSIPIPAGEPK